MGLTLAATLVAPGVATAGAVDLFYERTVMTVADSRCGLFEGPVGAALAAGQAQARGAVLRAGTDRATLKAVEARARQKASVTPCDSEDLNIAATRVRQAFDGYAQMGRMTYPGDHAPWLADRASGEAARWRLQQQVSFGWNRMVFGLAGRDGANALMAVASFPDGQAPYAARLVLRDASVTLGPYLDNRGEALGRLPLARRLPPTGAQTAFSAEARSYAGRDLLPKDLKSGWAFRFPAKAAAAVAALDPREAVAVEFLFADGQGDSVRRAYVEVGDFAAGRAFLQVASR
ncbi:hypothetical protein [Phenylobacterium sp.]|uniref:hypothetical protein n=1 Tax=Phenylobacterium sp. TaxID=1871053 RepID=UPI00273375AF|nr:hypothetical protein [Phenylobacterium sp.]MDP3855419.1 hypothetical protein [Phenylobacterium sp.]